MLKTTKSVKVEIDPTIDENRKYAFIEKKVSKAINTLKHVGLPKEFVN